MDAKFLQQSQDPKSLPPPEGPAPSPPPSPPSEEEEEDKQYALPPPEGPAPSPPPSPPGEEKRGSTMSGMMGAITDELQQEAKDVFGGVKSLTGGVVDAAGHHSRLAKAKDDVQKVEQKARHFSRPPKKWIVSVPYESRPLKKAGQSKMDSLFPFGKKGKSFIIFAVRSLHFITAILLTIVIQWLFIYEVTPISIFRTVFALLPLLLVVMLAPRTMLPLIIMVTSVEQKKHVHDIRDTVIEMKAVQTLHIMRTLTVVHAQARRAMMLAEKDFEAQEASAEPSKSDTPNTAAAKGESRRMSTLERKAMELASSQKRKMGFGKAAAKEKSKSISEEGAAKPVEQLDELSKAQLAELRQAFNLFDKDKSGDIDKEEVGELLKTLGMRVTQGALDRLFAEMDVSSDGKVEFYEFAAYMASSGFALTETAGPTKMADYIFEIFDGDGGGSISSDELRQTLTDLQSELDVSEVDEAMRMFDLDGSGKITKVEFIKALETMNTFVAVSHD
jgi:calmodulin